MLGESLPLGVPAAGHDLLVDVVALGAPPVDVGWPAAALGEPDRAVEGDPALHPAVGEVLAAAAGFPDAFVGLVPVIAEPVDHVRDGGPALVGRLQAARVDLGDGVERLAVDVELQLVGGAVADPDRA